MLYPDHANRPTQLRTSRHCFHGGEDEVTLPFYEVYVNAPEEPITGQFLEV